jgi:hypothetical protein
VRAQWSARPNEPGVATGLSMQADKAQHGAGRDAHASSSMTLGNCLLSGLQAQKRQNGEHEASPTIVDLLPSLPATTLL